MVAIEIVGLTPVIPKQSEKQSCSVEEYDGDAVDGNSARYNDESLLFFLWPKAR